MTGRLAVLLAAAGCLVLRAASSPGQTQGSAQLAPEISTAAIPKDSPLASRLSHVPDITVRTTVGILPHLPADVPARYRDGSHGPDVRVIWPAPIDTRDVLKPGSYTVSGKVPGTAFAPKATVIVEVPIGTLTPPDRLVEPFALGDVVLERDTQGRETPFIRNRDKFVRSLAASHPDAFLYNPNVASLFYGPVLLAAQESAPRTDWRRITVDARDPGRSIAGDPATLRFTADGVAFRPFYESYGRYSVYVQVVSK